MIGKVDLRHSLSNKLTRKGGDEKAGSQKQKEQQKETGQQNHQEFQDDIELSKLQAMVDELNANTYYRKKNIHFEIWQQKNQLSILTKSETGKVIQEMTIFGFNRLYEMVKAKAKDESPVKGGLLNISG